MAFDPLNLLLLAIALIVFWRLRSVLGTRTGNERPPVDPFGSSRKGNAPASTAEPEGKILRFPQPENAEDQPASQDGNAEQPVWTGYAEPGTALAQGLERLAGADSSFSPGTFINGAKRAYETIVDAFARGDKGALKSLLSKEVFDGFSRAINERESAGQRIDSRFVGIDKAAITAANLAGNRASITVRFVSELITATQDKAGEVIDGDAREIREITDVWTFERDINSRNPNWKLVATQATA